MTKSNSRYKPVDLTRHPSVMDDAARATFHALDLAHRYTRGNEVAIPLKDGRVLAGVLRGATATHVLLNTAWIAVTEIKE